LDQLPQTIPDEELLALLGNVLDVDAGTEATSKLRLRFFHPGFSWQALVDLALAHDLLPALVFALSKRSLLPPVPATLAPARQATHVTTRLASAYSQHLARQADLREQLIAVVAALNARGRVPVLLKGAVHLTRQERSWNEARSMRDLDILVRAADAPAAYDVLLSLGYLSDPDPPPLDRHLPEMRLMQRSGTIELHTEALAFRARRILRTDEVWTRAEMQAFAGRDVRILPPEWHLLHGLLHHQVSDRGHVRRLLALKGLWEFAMVGNEVSAEGWQSIIAHMREHHAIDVLGSWVIQANRLFGLPIPSGFAISDSARRNAVATFRRASAPYALRWILFTADRLRFAFSLDTLAVRYGDDGNSSLPKAALAHLMFLLRRFRARVLRS
jgi:hypothetical protein